MTNVKSAQISRYGGPEVFRIIESPSAPITPNGVRIRVTAAGVNFADLMMRMGSYPEAPPRPFVPGYEVAGTITEIGAQVLRFKVGERVMAATRFGGYTSEIVLPENQTWRTPDKLTDIEAAAIPVNFLTAWVALEEMARVRKGDRVLIQSAAGGVGIAAVQIAARAGAQVTGLVSSESKAQAVKTFGAKQIILNSDWESGSDQDLGGYDMILDATGGRSLKRSFARLKPGGRIIHYGVASMITGPHRSILKAIQLFAQTPFFHPLKLMNENKGIFGINLLQLFHPQKRAILADAMEKIMTAFEQGEFQVVIGRTFPLEEVGAAHSHLQGRGNVGKVVLSC